MMNTETGSAKLFGKIAKVMGECRILEKSGRNTFDKYDYVTADTIATRIGSLLAANGIAFLPSMVSLETNEYTTQKGGTNFRTVAHFQMTLACNETGATFTTMWMGEAIDRSDKSISKAATSAVKYFLLKTFLLAGGDEEDADSQSPTVQAHDDNPFDDAPTEKELVSPDQLKRLNILGRDYYGAEWDEVRPKLVIAVTTGATDSSKELTPKGADKLIKGIEKRIAERHANGTPVAA